MSLQIYINEQLIELPNDDTIGLNFQVYSIFNTEGRTGFASSPIKAPKTRKNNIVFESLSNVNSATVLPYRKLTAKVVQNGIEIVPNGFAIIKETSESYQFNVFSGNVAFFDLIKGLNVNEIDYSDLNHDYLVSNIIASFASTSGYIYPIVDWGNSVALLNNTDTQNANALIPVLYAKEVLERSASEQGFSLDGTFTESTQYDRQLITPNRFLYPTEVLKPNTGYADSPVGQSGNIFVESLATATGGNVIVDVPLNFQFTAWDNYSGGFFIPDNYFSGAFDFNVRGHIGRSPTTNTNWGVDIVVQEDGIDVITESLDFTGGGAGFNYNIQPSPISWNVKKNSTYKLFLRLKYDRHATTDYNVSYTLTIAFFRFAPTSIIPYLSSLNMAWFYDTQQVDVWKDIMNQYCLIMQTNEINKTIYLNYLNDITANIQYARNWSNKIVKGGVKVSYDVGSYAQKNYIKYAEDEDVLTGKGDGFFNIDDENLEPTKELFRLKAAAVEDGLRVVNKHTPLIPFQTSVGQIFDKKKSRYILLDKETFTLNLTAPVTAHNDTATTNIPFTYFEKSGKNDNLDFQSLIDTNYSTLTAMFDKYKRVVCQAKLTELDVLDFDFTIPIYVEYNDGNTSFSGNYYVNKISDFKRNKTTTLELIRL